MLFIMLNFSLPNPVPFFFFKRNCVLYCAEAFVLLKLEEAKTSRPICGQNMAPAAFREFLDRLATVVVISLLCTRCLAAPDAALPPASDKVMKSCQKHGFYPLFEKLVGENFREDYVCVSPEAENEKHCAELVHEFPMRNLNWSDIHGFPSVRPAFCFLGLPRSFSDLLSWPGLA